MNDLPDHRRRSPESRNRTPRNRVHSTVMLSGSARKRSGRMPRTRPPYPPEFRQEAVRLLRSSARSTKQLAEELGCSPQTLTNWLRQDEADRSERSDVLTSEERARLRELERENKVLRQEREI